MYQPVTTDPYQALQTDASAIPSAVNPTNCSNSKTATAPYVISSGVFCVGSDLVINNAGSSPPPLTTYFSSSP